MNKTIDASSITYLTNEVCIQRIAFESVSVVYAYDRSRVRIKSRDSVKIDKRCVAV